MSSGAFFGLFLARKTIFALEITEIIMNCGVLKGNLKITVFSKYERFKFLKRVTSERNIERKISQLL